MKKNKTLKLITPHKYQKELIDIALEPKTFFLTAVIGRQFGKTTAAENLMLYWAINDSNSKLMWVSPTDKQASKVYKEIHRSIEHTGLVARKIGTQGSIEMELINGSIIYFRSARSEDSLRGDSINYMCLDEAAFIKRETVESILLPMLNVTGKKCLFITTPKGKNYIYDYYKKGLEEDLSWRSLRYSSLDSPLMNKNLLKLFKETLSPKLYEQEIEAKFVDSASVFNNIEDLMILPNINKPLPNKKYFAGIDIGLVTDATVVSIVDENGNVVSYYRFVNIEAPKLITMIIELNKIWNFKHILIELNNQGLPIYQELKRYIRNISGFNTTAKSKPEIINRLIHLFNIRGILLPNDELMKTEFEGFIFKQTNTGHIKYMADNGLHDDIVIATAIAIKCYETHLNNNIEVFKMGL